MSAIHPKLQKASELCDPQVEYAAIEDRTKLTTKNSLATK